jgi:hypothetical protein
MTDETIAPVQKRGGWPKGKPRGPRVQATAQRAPQRTPQYRGQRTAAGRIKFSDDVYYINPEDVPNGMSWEWKRRTYVGKEDTPYQAKLAMNGWEAVDGSAVPQFGISAGEVDIGGLVLMQRPKEMTDEARHEDYTTATGQVKTQFNRLEDVREVPANTLPRDNRGRPLSSVRRDSPIQVRSDNEYERAPE